MNQPILNAPFVLDVNALPVADTDHIHPVYSNNAILAITPWDIRLIFTEIITSGKPGEIINELRASVAMSPAHAKAMATAMAQTIEAYEKVYGEIKLPSSSPDPSAKQSL